MLRPLDFLLPIVPDLPAKLSVPARPGPLDIFAARPGPARYIFFLPGPARPVFLRAGSLPARAPCPFNTPGLDKIKNYGQTLGLTRPYWPQIGRLSARNPQLNFQKYGFFRYFGKFSNFLNSIYDFALKMVFLRFFRS